MQPQIQNGLCLKRRHMVSAIDQTITRRQVIRTNAAFAGTLDHFNHVARRPALSDQFFFRLGRVRTGFDQFNDRVNVSQGNGLTFQHVAAATRFFELENSPARDHFPTVRQEGL